VITEKPSVLRNKTVICSLNGEIVMKFEFEMVGNHVEIRMKREDRADRLEEVCLNKKVYIRDQAPTREKLEETINLHVQYGGENKSDVIVGYYLSRRKVIEEEAKNIIKSYMKIQQSVQCIDIIDKIALSSDDDK
jgi:hypothetical protein